MTNPLIDKYFELYPEKKEKPKVIKDIRFAQEYECEFIKAENVKVEIKGNSSGVICAKNPPSLKTYDPDSGNDAFLQIADKIKNGNAQVSSMSMEMGDFTSKTVTFEVLVYE
jgi:hypothetical protein